MWYNISVPKGTERESKKNMRHYSILVKIDNLISEIVFMETLPTYIDWQGGEVLGITKEDENIFCFEFAIYETLMLDEEVKKNIFSLLQHFVVGL